MVLAADLLSPSLGLFFWLLVVFGALLWLLWRFAWGPITSALQEREDNIATSLSQAELAMEEARNLKAQNNLARREAEQEALRVLREARDQSERIRAAEVQRTREEINDMRAKALVEIERDTAAALQAVRSEIAGLAIVAAERILQENLDASRQRMLVDQFLRGLSSN